MAVTYHYTSPEDQAPRLIDERYFCGLDLGQTTDPSALAALLRRRTSERHPDTGKWQTVSRYTLRGLRRWPLGTLYLSIIDDVVETVARDPLQDCVLGADQTGVGKPVLEQLAARKPQAKLRPVLITAGHKATIDEGVYHVPKRELVACLQMVLQGRRLELPDNIPEVINLEKELRNFKAKITAAKNEVFEAAWRDGVNDDMVLAVAIALWLAEREAPPSTARPVVVGWGGRYAPPAGPQRPRRPDPFFGDFGDVFNPKSKG